MKTLFSTLDGLIAALGRVGGSLFGLWVLLALPAAACAAEAPKSPDPWVVHEWGTFTSLQDETGKAIGGINTDDEPVPKFVHRLADYLLLSSAEIKPVTGKGLPHCLTAVTMRLETPVLYFHPPASQPLATGIDVTAKFRGGWLSEFYPNAVADAPGFNTNAMFLGTLTSETVGTLAWKNLAVGGDWAGPATDAHVWTAPRKVRAAAVRTAGGESERYLFYRGVGHIDAPLAVAQEAGAGELVVRSQCPPELEGKAGLGVRSSWLVDIRADGKAAFRAMPPLTLDGNGKVLAKVSSRFGPGDYTAGNLEKMKAALREALVQEGLFWDEAQALLNTWEVSYFKTAGMRVFFMVPRVWTDLYLPLSVSTPAEITRVMVGRIELVTPGQRDILKKLDRIAAAEMKTEAEPARTGLEDQAGAGGAVGQSYELYLGLGRFRNALVLDEAGQHPSAGLDSFITEHGLEGHKPEEAAAAVLEKDGTP
jgi:hypothetical protein